MPLQNELLRDYVRVTSGVTLSCASLQRAKRACEATTAALLAVSEESLFDTEAGQLHSVLDALAGDDDAHEPGR